MSSERLYEGADWSFETLRRIHDACEGGCASVISVSNVYPNQIEVITAEQMLDAYSSIGHGRCFYKHWSFGKHFAQARGVLNPQGPDGALPTRS